jgi:hypothetical protein
VAARSKEHLPTSLALEPTPLSATASRCQLACFVSIGSDLVFAVVLMLIHSRSSASTRSSDVMHGGLVSRYEAALTHLC